MVGSSPQIYDGFGSNHATQGTDGPVQADIKGFGEVTFVSNCHVNGYRIVKNHRGGGGLNIHYGYVVNVSEEAVGLRMDYWFYVWTNVCPEFGLVEV